MRFFAISAAALSLASGTFAQSSWSTATSTRTVYAITTETRTGTPAAETQNTTSTMYSKPSYGAPVPTGASNGTAAGGSGSAGGSPTTSGPSSSFTNAAGKTTVGSIVVMIGGAVVALAL